MLSLHLLRSKRLRRRVDRNNFCAARKSGVPCKMENFGFFIVDYVIGKHLVIDYAVALSPEGTIKQIEILNYRESYGGEIRNPDWRKQFVGKGPQSRFALNQGINNISGATLSCRHVTEGIHRILATYETCLK